MSECQMSTTREVVVVSGLPTEEVTLTWTIKNFKTAYALAKSSTEGSKKMFATLNFEAGANIGVPSNWQFYFKQSGEEDMESFLSVVNKGKTALAKYSVSLYKQGGDFASFKKTGEIRSFGNSGFGAWGWTKFATISQLQTDEYLSTADDDDLKLKLTLTIFGHKIEASDTSSVKILPEVVWKERLGSTLSADLAKLLEDKEGADVNITLKRKHEGQEEDVQIKAHKNILGARSSVFAAMFNNGMKEANGEVEIPDIELKTMKIMLKFMYTSLVDDGWTSVAENLMLAADKYDLQALKEFMDANMGLACTPQNAHNLMKKANLYNMPVAVKTIQDYIKENLTAVLEDMTKD